MSNAKLEIEKVNKYAAGWHPSTLYTGFRIRAILKEERDAITQMQNTHLMRRRLKKEFGAEGEDWKLEENFGQNTTDLYLLNTGKLIMWKLQDPEGFRKLFDAVEQHVDNLDEIRERQPE